jgi:hypothetical protein
MVELSDGAVAMVVADNPGMPLRPVVKLLMDSAGDHPAETVTLDLSQSDSPSIARAIGALDCGD